MIARPLLLALALTACGAPPPPPAWTPDDEAALRRDHDAAEALAKAAQPDWALFVATHYTEDAVVLPPNGPALKGREAITAYFSSFPPTSKWETEYVDVMGSGDLAVAVGTYDITVAPPGQPEQPDQGKWIEVFRKQPDGHWKTVRDTFNSDLALPAAPAEATPAEAAPAEAPPADATPADAPPAEAAPAQ